MPKKPKKKQPTQVESITHGDKRVNNPTVEMRDFLEDEEREPTSLVYPRDTSLDPQLVWAGKDEQDSADLEAPVVPVYIQEKIHPQALVEELRRTAKAGEEEPEVRLFADFNGIPFEEMIDFYHHEQNWANRMILGDSLLVMASLAEKEGLRGQVQMIYLDPPYGIKFGSNWQVSTRKRDVKDGRAGDATRQPEQVKAYRDTWELGIHSYLAYLRDRFVAARDLLTESGSIFVQIGDENVHLVRCALDEVFGSENFVSLISVRTSVPLGATYIPGILDYIIWYGKEKKSLKFRRLFKERDLREETRYSYIELPDGVRRRVTKNERFDRKLLPDNTKFFVTENLNSAGRTETCVFPFEFEGEIYNPTRGKSWKTNLKGMENLVRADKLYSPARNLNYVLYLEDYPVREFSNLWDDSQGASDKIYVVQTAKKVIQRCLLMATDPGDLVLDPTCGSGTTAYIAEQWGRRWITVDTSRVALALARTRLMSARYPYYLLGDSAAGQEKESEITGIPRDANAPAPASDIKKGFVYKRVPHIMLKTIANNEDIDVIYQSYQEKLEPLRANLNKALKQKWQDWEIPREAEDAWTKEAKDAHKKWWELRLARQREIDDSIARAADQEILYDQPYEDKKTLRVSGPFTVESLSPHRVIAPDSDAPRAPEAEDTGAFVDMILENLHKAGVQNTVKNERLTFDRLERYAGTYVQAESFYSENGEEKRAAICVGPERGTVGPWLVKEAAKEAVQGVGFDMLIICGFAFDPHVAEEATRYGKLVVLSARMNPDLAMGDELLKKTGSGNLFMVFGEPDVELNEEKNDRLSVTIRGVDIYDPTTGEIRSNSTDDVACWFVDTNYNGESFFVRHAYFTGADKPYDKLKRTLKNDISETAWNSLYKTKSRPFDRPESGKIAVKVINHYGDEVVRVIGVDKG
ncbi:MAG: site-specific DNA-methyltransferase [bacterium]|nr:site-specific DNA-methyltransferase [bacterium]